MSEEVSMLSSGDGFSSSAGISSFGSGGIGGSGVPPLSREGKEAAGDGGGRTKEPGRNGGGGTGDAVMLVLNSGICREGDAVTDLPASAVTGITSVSKGGTTFCFPFGDAGPRAIAAKPEDRRETRVLRGLAILPLSFLDDLRGEMRSGAVGAGAGRTIGVGMDAPGAGVGGSSASIMSTCQDRFSSKNFSRSA